MSGTARQREREIRAQEGEELAREFYAKQNVAPDPGSLSVQSHGQVLAEFVDGPTAE